MTVATRIIAGVLLVISAAAEIRAQTVDLFEAREYRCSNARFKRKLFKYRLFVPRGARPGERFPLLLWLHGLGEGGDNNTAQLRWIDLMLDDPRHAEKYRFFVLAVQCPWDLSWSGGAAGTANEQPTDMLSVTADILQETMDRHPVERDRVYLAGISAGAAATWEMAMRHPELFAAVVPLACASGSDESRAAKLVKIPIWVFINKGERAGMERMVAAVRAAGGNAYLTVADAAGHDAWSAPLKGGILQWMLAQRRGAPCWTPPGHDVWQWWHELTIPAAVVVFVRLAWFIEQWRRRPRKMAPAAKRANLSPDQPGSDACSEPLESRTPNAETV